MCDLFLSFFLFSKTLFYSMISFIRFIGIHLIDNLYSFFHWLSFDCLMEIIGLIHLFHSISFDCSIKIHLLDAFFFR